MSKAAGAASSHIDQQGHNVSLHRRVETAENLMTMANAHKHKVRWSIRAHLYAFAVALLIPWLIFSVLMLTCLARADRQEAEKDSLAVTRALAAAVDREVSGVLRAIQTLATSARLRDGDFEHFYIQARDVASLLGTTVVYKLATGQQVINTAVPWGTPLGSFLKTGDRKALELRQPYISDLFEGTTTGRLLTSVNVPIFRDGEIVGVLTSAFDPQRFTELMARTVPYESFAGIIDRQGRIIGVNSTLGTLAGQTASEDLLNAAHNAEGVWSGANSIGVHVLGAYVRTAGDWRVATGVPISIIETRLWRNTAWLVGLGLTALLTSIFFASVLSHHISKPLNQLATAASEVASVESSAASSPTSIREVDAIGSALARSSEQLRVSSALRDRAEAALRQNSAELRALNHRFQAMMDHAPVDIAVKDPDGRYLFVNRAFERTHGMSSSEILGKTARQVFSKHRAEAQATLDAEVLNTKRAVQREMTLPGPRGTEHILFTKFPLLRTNGEIEAICAITTDMSEQRRTEIQLAHVDKMKTIGQLTGGVAHDFNNLLTVILGNADLLLDQVQPKDREIIEVILHAAERGADLTRRLLAFARRQVLEPRPTKPHELLSNIESLLRRSVGEHIELTISDSSADEWRANVDPGQLETAVLNLAVNARDAMPKGGTLSIDSSTLTVGANDPIFENELDPGDYVVITVSDTGVGMEPVTAARAFEPFFTTKQLGEGTGLGLSMVYGFAKQSKGHVKIRSELGRGTTVRLYLPRWSSETIEVRPKQEAVELPRGTERILVVEDDPLVCNSTKAHLTALGYDVVTAESGADAIRIIEAHGRPDLLLTDIVMPGQLDGIQLAERVHKHHPDLKVLFTSGYAHEAMRAQDTISGAFIAKPFRRAQIAVKLRQVLEDRPS